MLNLTEISARIKHPELCVTQDIDSLKTLCETYPYSQIFPLLYLKTLAQTNDVRLDGELQKFAYRIADRVILFDLLNSKQVIETTEQNSVVPILTEEIEKNENTSVIEEKLDEIVSVFAIQDVESVEEQVQDQSIIAEEIILEEEPVIVPKEEFDKVANSESIELLSEELPSLPDDILNSISIGTEMYSLEAEEAKIAAQKQQEEHDRIEKEALEQEKQKLIAALSQKKPITESRKENEFSSEKSFTSWLKHNSAYVEQEEEKPDPEILIDRFIQNDPKISSQKEKLFQDRTDKNELFSPIKKAKESLDESQLPVSETLAKIFAAQGNYPKAIFAYQQLMLIFPEKKVFFASQIEELNKKINT